MARPDPPRSALVMAVRLRVERLDSRCVPATLSLEPGPDPFTVLPPPTGAVEPTAPTVFMFNGPVLTVPVATAVGRDAVVNWSDAVVTPGVVLTLDEKAEVWAERLVTAGTTYHVSVELTAVRDPSDRLTFENTITPEPPSDGFTPAEPDPPIDLGPWVEPDPGPFHGDLEPPAPPPVLPPPIPPAVPAAAPAEGFHPPQEVAPAPAPAPPTPAAGPGLPAPSTDSPFRAGEARALEAIPPVTKPAPVAEARRQKTVAANDDNTAVGKELSHATESTPDTERLAVRSPVARLVEAATRLDVVRVASDSPVPPDASPESFSAWVSARAVHVDNAAHHQTQPTAGDRPARQPLRAPTPATGPVLRPAEIGLFAVSGEVAALRPTSFDLGPPLPPGPRVAPRSNRGLESDELIAGFAATPTAGAVFVGRPDEEPDPPPSWVTWQWWAKRVTALAATAGAGYRLLVVRRDGAAASVPDHEGTEAGGRWAGLDAGRKPPA